MGMCTRSCVRCAYIVSRREPASAWCVHAHVRKEMPLYVVVRTRVGTHAVHGPCACVGRRGHVWAIGHAWGMGGEADLAAA